MDIFRYLELVGFGPNGWGAMLLGGAVMTILAAAGGFCFGGIIGSLVAGAKISNRKLPAVLAGTYTTILRGVPDLIIIYVVYFGGSTLATAIGQFFGAEGFIGAPPFLASVIALGVVSGAYQAEVIRGAYQALSKGEIEAARSVGMHRWLTLRRIILPQVLRHAIPGLGNVWQLLLKQSALISVTGVTELLFVAKAAGNSTTPKMPFTFYLTAAILYLIITVITGQLFNWLERRALRGVRQA